MWNPVDCYAMTGTLRAAGLPPGEAKPVAGLTDGLLPVWMLHRVSGKRIVYALRIDLGLALPRRSGRWKSRSSDTMADAIQNLF